MRKNPTFVLSRYSLLGHPRFKRGTGHSGYLWWSKPVIQVYDGNWFFAMRDTEVTVLAESSGYSCVILNLDEGRTAGWINSKYLVFRD